MRGRSLRSTFAAFTADRYMTDKMRSRAERMSTKNEDISVILGMDELN